MKDEMFAVVHAFDIASEIRVTINNIFDHVVKLSLYTAAKAFLTAWVHVARSLKTSYSSISICYFKAMNYAPIQYQLDSQCI